MEAKDSEIYQFKAKQVQIKEYIVYLGNITKGFKNNNMKKNRIKKNCEFFSVDFNPIDTKDILDIDKFSMKRKQYKRIFEFIKKHLWDY